VTLGLSWRAYRAKQQESLKALKLGFGPSGGQEADRV
jgi:hypothetical protein